MELVGCNVSRCHEIPMCCTITNSNPNTWANVLRLQALHFRKGKGMLVVFV